MVQLTIDNVAIGLRIQLTTAHSVYAGTIYYVYSGSYKSFNVKWDGLGNSGYDEKIFNDPNLTWNILSEQSLTTETFSCKNCNKQNDMGKHVCWSCASFL